MRALVVCLVLAAACGDDSATEPCFGECACAVDTDCGDPYAACDEGTCRCSPGYAPGEGDACAWSGIIKNPGFTATGDWDLDPYVTIFPERYPGLGTVDLGLVEFSGRAKCEMARISQTLTMPKASRSEPLVLEITTGLAYTFGTNWELPRQIQDPNGAPGRSCLGAAAYAPDAVTTAGIERKFSLSMPSVSEDCPSNYPISLDHVEIKPANPGECPTPGTVLNGDFESDTGWSFYISKDDHHGGTGSGQIEAGVGENNSRGARLFLDKTCQFAGMTGYEVSVPRADQIASPALQYFVRATAGSVYSDINGHLINLRNLSMAGAKETTCLAPSMRGTFVTFAGNFAPNGSYCDQIVNAEAVFDNFEIVDEPSCGTDPAIADPGFEAVGTATLGAYGQSSARAQAISDPANAHSGTGVLAMSSDKSCLYSSFLADVVVPPASGPAGPALAFFYKGGDAEYRLTAKAEMAVPPVLVYDNSYHRGVVCLNPLMVGRRQLVTFELTVGSSANCYQPIPVERAFIDDLSATTDTSCPAM